MLFFHVWILVIASAIARAVVSESVPLSCYRGGEKKEERKNEEDRWFAHFGNCQSGTLAAKLMVLLLMEALDMAWYGSCRPLTNLTQTFQVCHLCTFNVATIFVVIPTYGVLPYAMIYSFFTS